MPSTQQQEQEQRGADRLCNVKIVLRFLLGNVIFLGNNIILCVMGRVGRREGGRTAGPVRCVVWCRRREVFLENTGTTGAAARQGSLSSCRLERGAGTSNEGGGFISSGCGFISCVCCA